jgi:cytochrome c-type biogenesis protein
MQIDIFTAFIAGLASFFAPCTFTTIPVFLTYISMELGEADSKKHIVLKNVIYYILGFTTVFVLLGIGFAGISRFLISNKALYIQLGGAFLILMALFILFGDKFKKLTFMYNSKKINLDMVKIGKNPFAPFLLGLVNAFSWSPCIGPILGGILFMASTNSNPVYGGFLLLIYSLGMTLPLLVFALFIERIKPRLKVIRKYGNYFYYAGAIMMLITGLLFLTGLYAPLSGLIYQFFAFANAAS